MVDRQKLSSRLSALEGYLAELRGFRRVRRDQFLREPAIHHLAERYLHLACESVLDIAHHVIADAGLAIPATYKDAASASPIAVSLRRDRSGRAPTRSVGLRLPTAQPDPSSSFASAAVSRRKERR